MLNLQPCKLPKIMQFCRVHVPDKCPTILATFYIFITLSTNSSSKMIRWRAGGLDGPQDWILWTVFTRSQKLAFDIKRLLHFGCGHLSIVASSSAKCCFTWECKTNVLYINEVDPGSPCPHRPAVRRSTDHLYNVTAQYTPDRPERRRWWWCYALGSTTVLASGHILAFEFCHCL